MYSSFFTHIIQMYMKNYKMKKKANEILFWQTKIIAKYVHKAHFTQQKSVVLEQHQATMTATAEE